MKKTVLSLFVLLTFFNVSHAVSKGNLKEFWLASDYIVGAGDVLEITVWKDETLSTIVTVLPDGKISIPLIGEYTAMGKPVKQIRREIKKRIAKYMPKPEVTVSIKQVNSMWIYVIGKVINAGRFHLNGNINVLQALSMAGGLTPFADSEEIKIVRESKAKTLIFNFNFKDVARGQNLSSNIHLQKGDVVIVP